MKHPKVDQGAEAPESRQNVDENTRPPISYSSLIAIALKDIGGYGTLQQIYKNITDKHPYYAKLTAEQSNPGWQNSIRHSLSLKEEFVKVGRKKGNNGNLWTIKQDLDEQKLMRLFRRKPTAKRTPSDNLDAGRRTD